MGLKFSEAWARRLNNDVGDHVATRQTHRRFWQRVCGSIERRLSLVSFFGENLAAAAFGTFATLSANNGLMHRSKKHHSSITSSARESSVDDNSRPSVLAVLRFTTNFELGRLLDRKVARLGSAQDLVDVGGGEA